MPQRLRNFWTEARSEGRKAATGGDDMEVYVYQRNEGSVALAATLRGWAGPDGRLILDIEPGDLPITVLERNRGQRIESQR